MNDVAPYNMVFDADRKLVGLIDLDTAAPGPRAWDLAYLAYRMVPLTPLDTTGAGSPSLRVRRRRLELVCDAYADDGDRAVVTPRLVVSTLVDRLDDLAAFAAARAAAAAGGGEVASHAQGYRDDARWVLEHRDDLSSSDDDDAQVSRES